MKRLNKYVFRSRRNYYIIPRKGEHLILRRKHFNQIIIEEILYRMKSKDYETEVTFLAAANRLEAQCTLDYLVMYAQLNVN